MIRTRKSKLNYLVTHSPMGGLLTSTWLQKQAINSKLVWWYIRSGWLERIHNKIYKRVGANISWASVVSVLQQQLELPVHVGSKTALQLLGKAHYLSPIEITNIKLFTASTTKLPNWLTQPKLWNIVFEVNKKTLFKHPENESLGLISQELNGIEIQLAAPERAIFEVCYQVTKSISYEESLQLMENLPYLRPTLVQALLVTCTSIKTKRLFLHSAEKCQHEWLDEVNLNNIDLGCGKSTVGRGGSYDAKYKLSVPSLE